MTAPPDPLLTEPQLAEFLGIHTDIVKTFRIEGTGPRFVLVSPRRVRYDPADVAAWLDERKHLKTDEYPKTIGQPRTSRPSRPDGMR